MSATAVTPVGPSKLRSFRAPDSEWVPAQEKAGDTGETVTEVLRRALRTYAGEQE